jgi:hypothetical protein
MRKVNHAAARIYRPSKSHAHTYHPIGRDIVFGQQLACQSNRIGCKRVSAADADLAVGAVIGVAVQIDQGGA